jgi:hypothetical protein
METAATRPNEQQSEPDWLKPPHVKIPVARKLLGDKARSEIYKLLAAGLLDGVKDGPRTLIIASIEQYNKSLLPWRLAKSKAPEKSKSPAPRRRGAAPKRRRQHQAVDAR